MTSLNQNLIIFAGDDAQPEFTVLDADNQPVDISSVADITWELQRDAGSAILVTKTKTGGGIIFATDGTDGKFIVKILAANTTPLSGFYIFDAKLTDFDGNLTTVATGRIQVGPNPLWTYSGDPSNNNRDAIRFMIGDTIQTDPQLMDSEIAFALAQSPGNLNRVASNICFSLAAKFARLVDTVDRELRTMYSSKSRNYRQMAISFMVIADQSGAGMPYAGGISIADKRRQQSNTDRVQPQFVLGMDDNYVPEAPVGNETEN